MNFSFKKIKSSLFIKFSLVLLPTASILFYIIGMVVVLLSKDYMIAEKQNHAEAFTNYLCDISALHIEKNSYYYLEDLSRKLQDNNRDSSNILSVIFYDTEGHKLNPSGIEIKHLNIPEEYIYIKKKDIVYMDVITEKKVGTISVAFSLESVYEKVSEITTKLFLIFIFFFFSVIIIFSSVLFLRIIKPIHKLTQWVDSLAKGKFDTKSPYKSEDEVGYLAAHLEKMAGDLKYSFKRIETQKNKIEEYNVSLEDIIEERSEKLIKAEKMASLGGMVAGVAHEINTPIGITVTAASHLKKEFNKYKKLYENNQIKKSDFEHFLETLDDSCDLIEYNLNRASDLVQSFKRIAVDQSSETKRNFNFKEYCNEIILSLRPELKKSNHTIINNCDKNISFHSYPGVFSQILTNLIMNSIIHGFSDISDGEITIDLFKNNEDYILDYKDNGKGIHPSIAEKIFEPFFTTKRNCGGSGLGLNLVHNLIYKKLNGSIKCFCENKGAWFRITIPESEVRLEN